MAQPNVTIVAGKQKKKNINKFWLQQMNYKAPPTSHNAVRLLTEVPTGIVPPIVLPAQRTLIDLVGGNSPQIPSIQSNATNTNPPKNPAAIIAANTGGTTAASLILLPAQRTLIDLVDGNSPHIPSIKANATNTNPPKTPAAIIAANTGGNTAASLPNKKAKNMAKKNKNKKVAPNIANVAGNATAATPASKTVAGNPPGNASQQTYQPPKHFNNQQKKKWRKLQAKLQQKKSEETAWLRLADSSATGKDPAGSSGTPQIQEAGQSMAPVATPRASEAVVATSTVTTNPIPTLDRGTQPKGITLKTKKILQQEMFVQRINFIKSSALGSVPRPSVSSQEVNQSVPTNDTPQIVEAPVVPTPGPAPGLSTVPTVEILSPQTLNARSKAASLKAGAAPSQPSPKKQRPGPDMFAYLKYPKAFLNYPKGIPRSFLAQQQMSQEPGAQPPPADSPIWPNSNLGAYHRYPLHAQTFAQSPAMTTGENVNTAASPIFVQTENPVDVQQPYSPSDIYSEGGNNTAEPNEDSNSSEQNQAGQKRLSAFQRLGPLSQPKKPKLTINLTLNKEQPVREVVNDTDDDPDRYTPVHLRQDIIMSTDETVMKYLPNWPWRKNVGIRRSATARNSRSVMILEQEQMEEAYDKDNFFIQITVKGYPSTWTKERVLDAVLGSVKGYSLIPCFTEFYQHECKFLTLRSRSALIVLHKTGFYIHKDGVELTITISLTDLTLNQIDFLPRIILRKRVSMGYADKKLSLSAFTLQNDISHFIYFPLSRVSNQSEFIQLQSVIDWEHLTELDLSHNNLTDISGFDLHRVTPRLKHLNLSHNYLEKITVLLTYRPLPLKKIHLEGNPLCHDYIDPDHYVKVIRMMFPAVVEIDGVPIHRKGELPESKQNYCPEEAQEVTEKFLEIYFPLLDSGPDHRSLIQGMYDDDATLTVTYCYKLRYGQIYRCFRNLFLYARFLDEGETDSVVGAMSITKLINRWPHTEHDPFTFTVDVLYHADTTTILRISGILKLTAETLAEDEHLLSFTRTVVLYSEHGDEYKIQNEMVYWDEPSAAAARSAFRVNMISQQKINLKIESTTDEDLRDKLLKIFMKLTTMDKKISERCLELNNWNFKLALEHFTKLLKINNLDSLTQEVQVAT